MQTTLAVDEVALFFCTILRPYCNWVRISLPLPLPKLKSPFRIIVFSSVCQLVILEIFFVLALITTVDIMLMLRGTDHVPCRVEMPLNTFHEVYVMYMRFKTILRVLVAGFVVEVAIMGISLAFMCGMPLSLVCYSRRLTQRAVLHPY